MTLLQPRFLFHLELWLEKVAEYFNPGTNKQTNKQTNKLFNPKHQPQSFNPGLSTHAFQPWLFYPKPIWGWSVHGWKSRVESWGWKVRGWNVLQPIGKASPFQLIVMAMLEIVLYETNEHIGRHYIKARINQIIGLGLTTKNPFWLHIELNLFSLSPNLGH